MEFLVSIVTEQVVPIQAATEAEALSQVQAQMDPRSVYTLSIVEPAQWEPVKAEASDNVKEEPAQPEKEEKEEKVEENKEEKEEK